MTRLAHQLGACDCTSCEGHRRESAQQQHALEQSRKFPLAGTLDGALELGSSKGPVPSPDGALRIF